MKGFRRSPSSLHAIDVPRALREETTVMVVGDLGEVSYARGRGVGDKAETMASRTRRCCHTDLDRGGVLKEESGEGVSLVTELQPPRNTTPLDIKRVDRGWHASQRVKGVEAVRNGKGVEHRDVSYVKRSGAFTQMHLDAVLRDCSGPEDSIRRDAWIIRMRAQRARCQKAVQSDEGESAVMVLTIRSYKLAFHEPHIGMKRVFTGRAGRQVSSRAGQVEVGLSDEAVEIVDN